MVQNQVLIFENRKKKIEIIDPAGLMKADEDMPIKVTMRCDSLEFRRCEAKIGFVRGVFFSDIKDRLFRDIIKANLHYRGRDAMVLCQGEDAATLVDTFMSDEEIRKAFPEYEKRIGSASIYDATPTQISLMETIECDAVFQPNYRNADQIFLIMKSKTETALQVLKDTLDQRQCRLLENAIEDAILLIETMCYQEQKLGWIAGTDCLLSAIKVQREENGYYE